MKGKKVRSILGKVVYYSIGVPVCMVYVPLMAIDIAILAVANVTAGVSIKDAYYTNKNVLLEGLENLEETLEWKDEEDD